MGPVETDDGTDNGLSGIMTWNNELNPKTNGIVVSSFNSVSTMTTAEDSSAIASAWYDTTNNLFWTWLAPKDIGDACAKHKSQVGDLPVWSLNQDTGGAAGGAHVKAIADCLRRGSRPTHLLIANDTRYISVHYLSPFRVIIEVCMYDSLIRHSLESPKFIANLLGK